MGQRGLAGSRILTPVMVDGGAGVWLGAHQGPAQGRRLVDDSGLFLMVSACRRAIGSLDIASPSRVWTLPFALTCRIMPSVCPWPALTSSDAQKWTGLAFCLSVCDIMLERVSEAIWLKLT